MNQFVLGLDFGTDSVRALVVDTYDGREISTAVVNYPRWAKGRYCNPAINQYRQHPIDYIEALEACIREALANAGGKEAADKIVGISFDATASTPALVDKDGVPLALRSEYAENPDAMFVLWKDHTAIEEADRINEVAHSSECDYTLFCGGTYSCEWVWSKALHCLRNSPEIRKDAWSWVEHVDWMAGLLTGETRPEKIARSRCVAGHKSLWHESWGGLPPQSFFHEVDPLLDLFSDHLYKESVTCDKPVGGLCREWAQKLGLKEGIAVGTGAIDCHVGAVGAGICPGTLVKVMGTSTCDIAVGSYEAVANKAIRGICGQVDGSVLPGYIGMEAGQSAFGDIYAWFSRFCGKSIPELTEEAEKLPLTPDDPIAIDWLNGRRTPDADPHAKGAFFGLTLGSSPAQVFKAFVEATVFGSRAINERFLEEGVPIDNIIAVGGISRKSRFVMQTMADVIGVPIKVLDSDQACALGAAMFAACVAGVYPDIKSAQAAMTPGFCAEYCPDSARHEIYNTLYTRYKELGR